ncbi:hypothetical protein YC2023_095419 [Brassica napus]
MARPRLQRRVQNPSQPRAKQKNLHLPPKARKAMRSNNLKRHPRNQNQLQRENQLVQASQKVQKAKVSSATGGMQWPCLGIRNVVGLF